jgi:hypothetical protein
VRADDCTGARINQARGCAFHDNWRVACQRRSMTLFSSRLPRRRPGRGRTKASAARAGAIDYMGKLSECSWDSSPIGFSYARGCVFACITAGPLLCCAGLSLEVFREQRRCQLR